MFIQDVVKILTDAGIEKNEADIEVRLLIENIAGYGLVDIITGKKLTDKQIKQIEEKARFRAKTRQPIQYIIGNAYFMGEKFLVNPSVLIPRDETEMLVRKCIELINENNFESVLDIGTGSGCIACIVAKNTKACVLGVDISSDALNTAISNMENLGLFNRALFRKSDIYSSIYQDEKFDVIISNPPYIPPQMKENIQKEVTFEPEIALYTTDSDGMEFYKKIIEGAKLHLKPSGYILFELGIGESRLVSKILYDNGFRQISVQKDMAGIDRIICARVEEI